MLVAEIGEACCCKVGGACLGTELYARELVATVPVELLTEVIRPELIELPARKVAFMVNCAELIELMIEIIGFEIDAAEIIELPARKVAFDINCAELIELLIEIIGFEIDSAEIIEPPALKVAFEINSAELIELLIKVASFEINDVEMAEATIELVGGEFTINVRYLVLENEMLSVLGIIERTGYRSVGFCGESEDHQQQKKQC